jgi:hypothetical protein
MGSNRDNHDPYLSDLDLINHTPLDSKPGRTVPQPLPGQQFVMEPFDQPKANRPRHHDDVFPLLIPDQDIARSVAELTIDPAMFEYAPHT